MPEESDSLEFMGAKVLAFPLDITLHAGDATATVQLQADGTATGQPEELEAVMRRMKRHEAPQAVWVALWCALAMMKQQRTRRAGAA